MTPRAEPDSAAHSSLAAAIVLALGTSGYAQVESFVNDGIYKWENYECLDITMPPEAQDSCYTQGPATFSQMTWQEQDTCDYYYDPDTGEYWWEYVNTYGNKVETYANQNGLAAALDEGFVVLRPFEAGEAIGPQGNWKLAADAGVRVTDFCEDTTVYRGYIGENQAAYLGVRFLTDDGCHYGWIRAAAALPWDDGLAALAWGYQKSPETPIRAGQIEGGWCYADLDADGTLDLFDFLTFTNRFNATDPAADCDLNGSFNLFDFLCFTNAFNTGC